MLCLSRAGCALVPLVLCALLCALPARAQLRLVLAPPDTPPVSVALIEQLDHWLDAHVIWPRRAAPPQVAMIGPAEAFALGGVPDRGHGPARGLYDRDTATVYLVRPWSAEAPQDVAVLLHELVHHRQVPFHFVCPAAKEMGAYRAQDAWLAERELSAKVNWFAIVWHAGCRPRDMHPD